MKEIPIEKCAEVGDQHDQDKGSRLGLVEYAIWKSATKSEVWISSNAGIYSDLSSVSSYPSQITLYRSLHAHWQSILKSEKFYIWVPHQL